MNPTPEQIGEFVREWIPRYSFAITMDDGPEWVDNVTRLKVRRNHVVCIIKNDLCNTFPGISNALARKVAEKVAKTIETRMVDRLKAGEGVEMPVPDTYL